MEMSIPAETTFLLRQKKSRDGCMHLPWKLTQLITFLAKPSWGPRKNFLSSPRSTASPHSLASPRLASQPRSAASGLPRTTRPHSWDTSLAVGTPACPHHPACLRTTRPVHTTWPVPAPPGARIRGVRLYEIVFGEGTDERGNNGIDKGCQQSHVGHRGVEGSHIWAFSWCGQEHGVQKVEDREEQQNIARCTLHPDGGCLHSVVLV